MIRGLTKLPGRGCNPTAMPAASSPIATATAVPRSPCSEPVPSPDRQDSLPPPSPLALPPPAIPLPPPASPVPAIPLPPPASPAQAYSSDTPSPPASSPSPTPSTPGSPMLERQRQQRQQRIEAFWAASAARAATRRRNAERARAVERAADERWAALRYVADTTSCGSFGAGRYYANSRHERLARDRGWDGGLSGGGGGGTDGEMPRLVGLEFPGASSPRRAVDEVLLGVERDEGYGTGESGEEQKEVDVESGMVVGWREVEGVDLGDVAVGVGEIEDVERVNDTDVGEEVHGRPCERAEVRREETYVIRRRETMATLRELWRLALYKMDQTREVLKALPKKLSVSCKKLAKGRDKVEVARGSGRVQLSLEEEDVGASTTGSQLLREVRRRRSLSDSERIEMEVEPALPRGRPCRQLPALWPSEGVSPAPTSPRRMSLEYMSTVPTSPGSEEQGRHPSNSEAAPSFAQRANAGLAERVWWADARGLLDSNRISARFAGADGNQGTPEVIEGRQGKVNTNSEDP